MSFYYVLVNGFVAVFVFILFAIVNEFLRRHFSNYSSESLSNLDSCKSPNCIRCKSAFFLSADLLIHRLNTFVLKTNTKPELLERILESLINKGKSSYYMRQRPTTLGFIGLSSQAWHCSYTFELNQLLTNFKGIKYEVERIAEDLSRGWAKNMCPSGCWYLYHLYDQGQKIAGNCTNCPMTTELIESVVPFMKGCIFGNAIVSLVKPGTHITPHYGPTNCRLRCHIPINVPKGCRILVDQEERTWKEGTIMLFDDSYLHEVWHNGHKGDRIVLILDLWHPEVNDIERLAINYIFSNML